MHNEWLDLIPYYVAGTLGESETIALEHHLARCEACFHALEEWREVAVVVRREVKTWVKPLPPLSSSVRAQLLPSSENGYNKTSTLSSLTEQTTLYAPRRPSQPTRRFRPSLPLIAAIITMVIFSGILIYGASQSGKDKSASSGDNLPSGLTATFTPFILPSSITASPTLTPSPSLTPFVINPVSQTPIFTPTPIDGCLVTPSTENRVNIYRWADVNSAVMDTLEPHEVRRTVITDGTGWYQVSNDQQVGIAGWVLTDEVTLLGDCNSLALPSRTPNGTVFDEGCLIRTVDVNLVNIYRSPGTQYDVISTLQSGEFLQALAQTQDGWYFQVSLESGSILGWVLREDVTTNNNCASLQVISPATIQPSATLPNNVCFLTSRSGFGSFIYAGPDVTYNIINSFSDPLIVTGRSDNNWYQVERWVGNVRWSGWVSGSSSFLSDNNCDNLPIIPSQNYTPTSSATSVTPLPATPISTMTTTPALLPTAAP